MSFFVDTSGLYALMVGSSPERSATQGAFRRLLSSGRSARTTNYVLLETIALLQSRFGLSAVRDLLEELLPVISVHWVTREVHERGIRRLIGADRRQLSLVDCVSFTFMESEGIRDALAIDRHFVDEGFRVIPGR